MDNSIDHGQQYRVWTKISIMDNNIEHGQQYRVWTTISSMDNNIEHGQRTKKIIIIIRIKPQPYKRVINFDTNHHQSGIFKGDSLSSPLFCLALATEQR